MTTTEHTRKLFQSEDEQTILLTDEMIAIVPTNFIWMPMRVLDQPEPIVHADEMDASAAREALADPDRLSESELRDSLGIE